MDKLKKFDAEFKKLNSYNILLFNVIKYLTTFFVIGTMIVFPLIGDDFLFNFYVLFFLIYALNIPMSPYLYIKQNKSRISIYKLMRDTPIRREDFVRSRLRHFANYASKLASACIVVRIISIFTLEDPSLLRILISLAFIAIIFIISTLIAIFDIYIASRY